MQGADGQFSASLIGAVESVTRTKELTELQLPMSQLIPAVEVGPSLRRPAGGTLLDLAYSVTSRN